MFGSFSSSSACASDAFSSSSVYSLSLSPSLPFTPSSPSDILQHPTAPSPISQAGILGYTRAATVPATWRRGLIELISFNG